MKTVFSLKDMEKAIDMARILRDDKNEFEVENILGSSDNTYGISEKYTKEEIIQSLSTQQLPKEFIPEYNLMNKGYDKPEDYPYHECKVLKTITNSEGKQELVGIYKY